MPLENALRGLAFDGGAGKAPVFFGALRALDEFGLLGSANESGHPIQHLVGSSTGSIIAALLACGAAATELEVVVA